jgi:hypothetical protein
MDFFASQYKALFQLPNDVYADVKGGLQPFFMTETLQGLHVADVVCVEPQISKDTNALIRENGNHGNIECEFLLITSVKRMENGVSVHGFVRLCTLPQPINNVIDALHNENRLLRKAVRRSGQNADIIAMGEM